METTPEPFADLVSPMINMGPRVVIIGHDRTENNGPIYEALERAGCRVVITTESVGSVDLSTVKPEAVIVRGDMVPRDKEPNLLASLTGPWKLVVLLGASRRDKADALAKLPNVQVERVLVVPPYDFHFLISGQAVVLPPVQPSAITAQTPASPTTKAQPVATASQAVIVNAGLAPTVRRRIRLGLYGAHGGVGVSTAALKIAQWLAEESRVILIDAAKRGDLHLLLGATPGARFNHGNLTVVSEMPSEALVAGFDVIIIDGGRQNGIAFNARWLEIRKPLKDDELRALLGLPATGTDSSTRAFNLGRLFSVRITE